MQDILLLVSLLGCAAIFVGLVMAVIHGRRGKAVDPGENEMLRDGIILAVLLPFLGVIWSVRLFVRERIGQGLAVLTISLLVMGAGVLFFLDRSQSSPSTTSNSAIRQVEDQIAADGYSDPACVSLSKTEMTCMASQGSGGAQVSLDVHVDPASGAFTIEPAQ